MHLLAIMGPTASGKTALAIELAEAFDTEIISVDARQVYREMSIGTAKPTKEELGRVKHHFIDHCSIMETYTAGRFAREARALLRDRFKGKTAAVAAGGSTLYYRALLDGLGELPPVEQEIRDRVRQFEEVNGLAGLQEEVSRLDPEYYAVVDQENPRRLARALEVIWQTGNTYTSLRQGEAVPIEYPVIKIGLDWPREKLYERINTRCRQMLDEGLLDEVRGLYPYRSLTALQTVGYEEFFDYLDGKCSLDEAINLFMQHTRNYAKRQLTWFRREKDIHWFAPEQFGQIADFVREQIKTPDT